MAKSKLKTILPKRNYKHYLGIDPGFTGGVVLMSKSGRIIYSWEMPIMYPCDALGEQQKKPEMDLHGVVEIFMYAHKFPDVCVGLEWPTTRPKEGAEACLRFGKGIGNLQAFCSVYYPKSTFLIPPNLWKGKASGLDLPGKTVKGHAKIVAEYFLDRYPGCEDVIYGGVSGRKLLDGPCDAALIAHFMRTL